MSPPRFGLVLELLVIITCRLVVKPKLFKLLYKKKELKVNIVYVNVIITLVVEFTSLVQSVRNVNQIKMRVCIKVPPIIPDQMPYTKNIIEKIKELLTQK